MKLKGKRQKND